MMQMRSLAKSLLSAAHLLIQTINKETGDRIGLDIYLHLKNIINEISFIFIFFFFLILCT